METWRVMQLCLAPWITINDEKKKQLTILASNSEISTLALVGSTRRKRFLVWGRTAGGGRSWSKAVTIWGRTRWWNKSLLWWTPCSKGTTQVWPLTPCYSFSSYDIHDSLSGRILFSFVRSNNSLFLWVASREKQGHRQVCRVKYEERSTALRTTDRNLSCVFVKKPTLFNLFLDC